MDDYRPFRTGDIIALGDERGAVLRDEKNGRVLVKVMHGAETWNAEQCQLAYRRAVPDEL
jgi:hypothetical protein